MGFYIVTGLDRRNMPQNEAGKLRYRPQYCGSVRGWRRTMCNDPIRRRGQAFNCHCWRWCEPFLIAVAVLPCADKHGAAEPCAQSACDVGLSIVTDHYRVFWRAIHARKGRFKEPRRRFP